MYAIRSYYELLRLSSLALTLPEDLDRSIEKGKIILGDGSIDNFEKRCITKNGKVITIIMSAALMPDKNRILITAKRNNFV